MVCIIGLSLQEHSSPIASDETTNQNARDLKDFGMSNGNDVCLKENKHLLLNNP